MNPYEVLKVPVDANPDVIKVSYRVLAQKLHPDKESGDVGKFQELKHAYSILSDPERRKQYDLTGGMDDPIDTHAELLSNIAGLIFQEVDAAMKAGDRTVNIIQKATSVLEGANVEMDTKKESWVKRSQELQGIRKRFKLKKSANGMDNLIDAMFGQQVEVCTKTVKSINEAQGKNIEMLNFLKDYKYDADKVVQQYTVLDSTTVFSFGGSAQV